MQHGPGYIEEEGIARLAQDLGIDPGNDVRILVLCWKLGPGDTAGRLSQTAFVTGMVNLGYSSVEALRGLLPSLDPKDMDFGEFREFYRYAYHFTRDRTSATLEKDIACALLPMVMGNRSPHTHTFVQFLEARTSNDNMTFDQWNSFLEFTRAIGQDLSEYSDEGAWPILLDEYVAWYKDQP
eukprot:TRINITY_DN2038_c0_g1_i4.p1 TRINITY_DN2038_c0_g1~~TRINITY_DN2038_c0_g1_i4.p1  ORF type:complete len:182 (-),score=24.68 TRINITY_DN2038_c0_g1_i4:133-678(-)